MAPLSTSPAERSFADEDGGAWARPGAAVFDVLLAAVLGLVALLGSSILLGSQGSVPAALLGLAQVATLVLRRVRPAWCLGLLTALSLLQLGVTTTPTVGQIAVPVAVYSATAWGAPLVARAAVALGLVGALVGPGAWWRLGFFDSLTQAAAAVVVCALVVVTAAALGALGRTRQAYVGELIQRGVRVETEAAQRVELAAAEERARIAREMHDVVAHGLSVVVVQADGARYQLDRDPAVVARALEVIAATGRESLVEMRRVLGLLREGAPELADPAVAPQPGLADLDALLSQDLGPGTTLRAHRDPALAGADLGPGLGLTVFRLVQEALTNVRKHAGPGVRVDVDLRREGDRLAVRVEDDGRGASTSGAPGPPGHGLIGMRERVALHDGTLEAGPRPGGGFRVAAVLPLAPTGATRG